MTEANIGSTIQQVIQDLVAPDLRELKVKLASLEQIMDARFKAVDARFEAVGSRIASFEKRVDDRFVSLERQMQSDRTARDAQFQALLASFREFGAKAETATTREVSELAQRLAVIETILSRKGFETTPQLT